MLAFSHLDTSAHTDSEEASTWQVLTNSGYIMLNEKHCFREGKWDNWSKLGKSDLKHLWVPVCGLKWVVFLHLLKRSRNSPSRVCECNDFYSQMKEFVQGHVVDRLAVQQHDTGMELLKSPGDTFWKYLTIFLFCVRQFEFEKLRKNNSFS